MIINLPAEVIEKKILLIRAQKVMLDSDLAALYAVETKDFNRAVKRNIKRFPEDFMFQLTREEFETLRCQFGTSKKISQNGTSKRDSWREALYSLRLYRTGGSHAVQRTQKRQGNRS